MLIPLMIIVLLVFSSVANSVVSNYTNQQYLETAQGALNQFGRTIQQLYYSLNHHTIKPCTVTKTNPLPATIHSYPYHITGYLVNTPRQLTLTLILQGLTIMVNKTITLSPNMSWQASELSSLSPLAGLELQKFINGTLLLSFK